MEKYVHRKNGRAAAPVSLAVLCVLLAGFSLVNLFWPKRDTSELENRKLAQLPAFSVKTLLNGKWQDGLATYVQDQIALRDSWIDLESLVNAAVLQKTEEGGILLGGEHRMFTRLFAEGDDDGAQLAKNVAAVKSFAARYPGHVTFVLAPSASVIYPDDVPASAPMLDEDAALDEIFSELAGVTDVIDLRADYRANAGEYLYFRTDHHWTPYGAYRAYEQFCTLKGLTPFDRAAHTAVTVTDFYGTHYSATRWWNTVADSFEYYDLPNQMTIYKVNGEADYEAVETCGLMDLDKLDTRDKYGAFLNGNNGYSVIEGNGEGSILVVKDSYANSLVPYLTANYAKIGVVDFRGLAYGLDSTIAKEGYEEILIVYNFQTFRTDTKVIYLDRPTTLEQQTEQTVTP